MISLPKFLNNKKEDKEFFLSLIINTRSFGAILFEKFDNSLHVISTKDEPIEDASFDDEEILAASDKVISFVETSLPEGASLNKTIFAVPYDWVESGRIKREYLAKLKKICESLDLTPIGFIISVEAIITFLKNKEGAPISSLFVEAGGGKAYVYVVKNDEIIEARRGEVEDSVPRSVEKILKRVENVEVLPSKIVLLDYEQAEEIQQEFLSYKWSKELPFLHIPQTVVLEKGFEKEAIISGVGSQMGFAVEMDVKAGKDNDEFVEKIKQVDSQEFGFIKDQDIRFMKKEEVKEDLPEESNIITPKFDDLQNEEKEEIKINDNSQNTSSGSPFTSLLAVFKKINIPKIPNLQIFSGQRKMGIIIIPSVFIILLIIFYFIYYSLILKADISVFTNKKSVNEKIDLTFSSSSATSGKVINVSAINEELSGQEDANVTGIIETGEKANGEVTVYNKTEQKKTIAKGSILGSSNNLNFVTLDDVVIASASAFATTFPSSKVKVEASKFGTEYNLPSGTNFTFNDIASSVVFAKNDSAFSGGTKKEVKSVSQKDLDNLQAKVFDDLEKQAIEKASQNKKSGEEILPQSLSSEYLAKSFNKKKGDASSTLHFNAKLKFKLGGYQVADIEKLVRESSGDVPDNYKYIADNSKLKLSGFTQSKNGAIKATLVADAVFSPDIKNQDLEEKIKGQGLKNAEDILRKINGVSSIKVILKNKLPLFPNKLPTDIRNINLIIKSDE